METCARCGKELGFAERNTWWNRQLKDGYIEGVYNEGFTGRSIKYPRKDFQELKGKKICKQCLPDIFTEKQSPKKQVVETKPLKHCYSCHYASSRTVQTPKNSLTNTAGILSGAGILEYNSSEYWICTKFDFDITYKQENANLCTSYITQTDYEKKCLSGQMDTEKSNIQIILDFASLKDVMSKGGLVMSTYKCPNCSGMVKLPEEGKMLVCEYCGTPIKPVDIFEKIKSLMSPITSVTQTLSIPIKEEIPFDLRGLKERLEKIFPTMVKLSEEERVIWVMGKVKMTEHGVVVGSGPAAKRCQMVYEAYIKGKQN